jgi:hypothetical protein
MHPVVRHLIVCDDIQFDPQNPRRATIVNLLQAIYALDQPPFPLLQRELCVLVQLTECRGKGEFWVQIVQADTGKVVRRTRTRSHDFGNDPLEVTGIPFRIRDCPFPEAGLYWVQFWYNNHMIAEEPLALRARP